MSEISDTATLIKLSSQGTYFLAKGSVKSDPLSLSDNKKAAGSKCPWERRSGRI